MRWNCKSSNGSTARSVPSTPNMRPTLGASSGGRIASRICRACGGRRRNGAMPKTWPKRSQARRRALGDKRLYCPKEGVRDPARGGAAGIPREQQVYRSETELALAMLQAAQARGSLTAPWVTGDDAFGKSPEFRDQVAATGFQY